jgi:Na+/H+-dicarboxylate symporter
MRQGLFVLLSLVLGVALGAWLKAWGQSDALAVGQGVGLIGVIWLDALRMTLVPLIFSVLVAALAGLAETASGGPLARKTLVLFACVILFNAVASSAATMGLLSVWPVDLDGARALMAGGAAGDASGDAEAAAGAMSLGNWLRTLVPTNVVAAAAENAILPVVVFACVFGFALGRLPADARLPLHAFFQSTADTMIVIVRWVLKLAPLGVFGLSLSLGLSTGLSTVGVLAHYVGLVTGITIASILLVMGVGLAISGLAPAAFLRALAPVQVIAASTQSSVASLPAMLTAAGPLGVPAKAAEFVLPLAVAVFRYTSPVANMAVALFLAHVHGVEPSPGQLIAALAVAFAVSVSSVGLPGQTSFFASIAPICLVLGVPVTLVPLLLAVEVIPDVFRTVGNVTANLVAARFLGRRVKAEEPAPAPAA